MNRAEPVCVTEPTSELLSNIPADGAIMLQFVSKIIENVKIDAVDLVPADLMTKNAELLCCLTFLPFVWNL